MPWKPELVKEAREQCGWTQDELAARVGVHRITITRVESGALRPGVDLFEALSTVLKVEPAELLGHRIPTRRGSPKAAAATKRSRS